jgi:hypothetical protein
MYISQFAYRFGIEELFVPWIQPGNEPIPSTFHLNRVLFLLLDLPSHRLPFPTFPPHNKLRHGDPQKGKICRDRGATLGQPTITIAVLTTVQHSQPE